MLEKILEALNETLERREAETKYWRDRAATLAGENEKLRMQMDDAAARAAQMDALAGKRMDEIDALTQDNASLKQEVEEFKRMRRAGFDTELAQRAAKKELLAELMLLYHDGAKEDDDGRADSDGQPGE